MRARKSTLSSTAKRLKPPDTRPAVESGDNTAKKLRPPDMRPPDLRPSDMRPLDMRPVTDMMESGDRISTLPEAVLHRILSFLDMRYVVRTSILSRRWRYIWTSVPNLDFDHLYFLSRIGEKDEAKNGFMDFVDRVLLLRNSSDIQNFRISCGWYCDTSRVNSWILVAVRRNVQEFHLKIRPKEPLELPHCLFTCKSLRVLKLDMDYVPLELKLPDSMDLPGLKTLHLELVNLDEKLVAKILSSCPAMETLILTMCQFKDAKNLIICSRQLKRLVIEACFTDHVGIDDCKINIWAPNLISLRCSDYMTKDYFLGNLSALVGAEFDMKIEEGCAFEETDELPSERKQVYAQRMIKCLRGLCRAKTLILSAWLLEMVSEAPPYVLECLPTPFSNLRYLKLKTWFSRDCIRAILYLLKCSPNLVTLVLETTVKNSSWHETHPLCDEKTLESANNEENWITELPFQCSLHHLKAVEMRNLQGCENELRFLKHLMKNAMVLEEMIIIASKKFASSGIKDKFSDKLQTFRQASPSLGILFF